MQLRWLPFKRTSGYYKEKQAKKYTQALSEIVAKSKGKVPELFLINSGLRQHSLG